ncbi:hypothetical protein OUZ56_029560 [Daphnia magna]|uniref:Uncharacterized protein n=1 Tax=Daphnia magna TaxID=35525 RepID=A0ABR0B766_9CRUS|nr:hypothetical protein OUZ56_029560 [Daphnia magna]
MTIAGRGLCETYERVRTPGSVPLPPIFRGSRLERVVSIISRIRSPEGTQMLATGCYPHGAGAGRGARDMATVDEQTMVPAFNGNGSRDPDNTPTRTPSPGLD